ncbi:peptidase C39 [Campylobacter sp. MIT 12-8780]|uniref:cysteine peptidase family C39 domain-containing protein n=1 Tax=unclassified Campylobacter TaxID=2593542 RepID=UPI00115E5ADC|nr:peptidase C39 [Campylobacter sp. MIT 19-121]TQR41317.1 peptidase C39 [Campylobacter sp. MIT 12-8780]
MEKVLKVLCLLLLLPLFVRAEFVVSSYQELKNQRTIRQNYEESCGAAALATLINLTDDKKLSELDLLKLFGEKELFTDMISFAELRQSAHKLDYKSETYQITRENLDKLTDIPMLVKIEDDPRFPHFVVIINHKGDFLEVLDPSHGEYLSLKSEFFSIWDRHKKGGYALFVETHNEYKDIDKKLSENLIFEFQGLK